MTNEAFAAAVRDLHRVLIADPPAIYLFWPETSRATGRRVTVPADSSGDVLGSLARWTVRSRRPVIPITRRMAMLVTTAALLPLLIFGIVAGWSLRTTTRDSVKESHAAIAARAAEAIHLYLTIERAARRSAVSDLLGTGLTRVQQARVLQNHVTITPEIRSLTLFDAEGRPVVTSNLDGDVHRAAAASPRRQPDAPAGGPRRGRLPRTR